mmetsp:Transcript_16298/g.35383  ORF Transcript_16298/g.35383 Transcript_16298/m.35383 type:complete len:208 (-) Transcript_16298:227-850(-)|eukprot:CAMPEP_0178516408 /NCGR_PEP_ID=MMETSP0696-20121128/25093_1 /TAXON_ID=265572 /ORGANISM="Extubocellulus spinifer, Strain CCMP396" /LENGTH=207 /DNA_ID=CAMNT_0020146673 /DNA_START=171 /DNA_END=797 /DNA_ORIENTATION=+
MTTLATWDDEYARLARAVSQLRTSGSTTLLTGPSRTHQVTSIRSGLDRLTADLRSVVGVPPAEIGRRRALIEGLRGQVDSATGRTAAPDLLSAPNSSSAADGPGGSQQQQQRMTASHALRQQDDMLADLSTGVSRLKDQTHAIHDEARLHNRLLDEMEDDVDLARQGLEDGALRAARVKEERNLWRLYMIIAGLSVLLFLLILMGLS